MHYLKDNWPHLLLTLLGSACSSTFVVGFAWGVLGDRVASAERRLDGIDHSHVDETHWQVDQNTTAISSMKSDARQTSAELTRIDIRLGIIESKLDGIAAQLKARPER